MVLTVQRQREPHLQAQKGYNNPNNHGQNTAKDKFLTYITQKTKRNNKRVSISEGQNNKHNKTNSYNQLAKLERKQNKIQQAKLTP